MRNTTTILVFFALLAGAPGTEAALGDHRWSQGWNAGGFASPDDTGHIAAAGTFFGAVDFGGGTFTPANIFGGDVFLARFDASGNHVWSRQITPGGFGFSVNAVTAAPDGSIYLAGTLLQNGDIDLGGGLLSGSNKTVLAGFEPDGSHRFSFIAGDGRVQKLVASNTTVACTGYTSGSIDFGGGTLTSAGGTDVFLGVLEADGSHRFSRVFGDAGAQGGMGLALDPAGGVVLAAGAESTIDFGGGVLTAAGGDLCLAAFDASGVHQWSWSRTGTFTSGSGILFTLDVAVSGTGDIAVGGLFRNTTDLGGGMLTSNGSGDVFVARYDANGSHLSSLTFGGNATDGVFGVSFDGDGNLAIAGTFLSSSVDFGGGPLTLAATFGSDWFLAVFDGSNSLLHSASYTGDGQYSILPRFDPSGRLLLYGSGGGNTDFGGGTLATTGFFLAQLDGTSTPTGPGSASDLAVGKSGADLLLSWGSDCGLGDAYGIYRGDLAMGYGSLAADSCDLATTQATIPMGVPDGEFFLVVPAWNAQEGSYGPAGAGDRASVPGACHLQGTVDQCAP